MTDRIHKFELSWIIAIKFSPIYIVESIVESNVNVETGSHLSLLRARGKLRSVCPLSFITIKDNFFHKDFLVCYEIWKFHFFSDNYIFIFFFEKIVSRIWFLNN